MLQLTTSRRVFSSVRYNSDKGWTVIFNGYTVLFKVCRVEYGSLKWSCEFDPPLEIVPNQTIKFDNNGNVIF